ncbi:MAG: X2-like carbohydrate binding domain-containing protein, partial [Oscillospiraceae bacterium]|nr:X2-like carbohydrate binding domain-containing protein [Oscillospiraceae bacterium]
VITTATIENAKFDYQPGDAPQATAEVYNADADKYEIAYECWQEFENNEPVAAWYSDNGSHGSLPTFTEFESGKKYVYSLMLMPKDGYSFTGETVITVNEQKVSAPFVGGSMYIPSVKTITMPTVTVIDVVEINNVTVSFKDGDKPVFTGKVPDGAAYAFRCEWWELDSKTGAMSTDFGNFYENKITAFEAGKTYHYGVYVTTYGDVGNIQYIFSPDTKLKINGEFVNYTRYEGDESDGSDGTMWVLTDLAMAIIPEYKITEGTNGVWKQNSNDTLTFRANGDFSKFTGIKVDGITVPADKYTAASGSTVITLKKAYLGTLSVGKHTLSVVYSDGECGTEFEIKAAPHSHSYGTEWKYDGTRHWHECICGDKADTAAHTFEWVTDKEPTDDEKGSKHEECTVCHATRNEHTEIPATGEDCLFTKICKFIIKIITKFVLWILDFINGIC